MDENETALLPPFSARRFCTNVPFTESSHTHTITHGLDGDVGHVQLQRPDDYLPSALQSLPTISGRDLEVYMVEDDIDRFLRHDLDLNRLNIIHGHLWMAGRPLRARPLHRYRMQGYSVLPTQQHDLHLLRFSSKLLLKPLPDYMLSYEFWKTHLCGQRELHASACGFLLSYIWLICSPVDLRIAKETYTLPDHITWEWWKEFVRDFCSHIDINALDQVNKRYHFGELRLSRINSIYRTRFVFTHFVRGYLYGYNRYVVFFQRKFGWILVVFGFFSLVLSAMQVGVSVNPLQDNHAFLETSYGFVVFSIVSVAAILAIIGVLFAFIFLFNMASAISHPTTEARKRDKLAEERRRKLEGA